MLVTLLVTHLKLRFPGLGPGNIAEINRGKKKKKKPAFFGINNLVRREKNKNNVVDVKMLRKENKQRRGVVCAKDCNFVKTDQA